MKLCIFIISVIAVSFIALCQLLPLTWEFVQTLITFNLLFLLILMPLKGSTTRKIAILLIGNIFNFLWSSLFYLFVRATAGQIGGIFNIVFAILSPPLNVLWIIAFWSTSLTFLAEGKKKRGNFDS